MYTTVPFICMLSEFRYNVRVPGNWSGSGIWKDTVRMLMANKARSVGRLCERYCLLMNDVIMCVCGLEGSIGFRYINSASNNNSNISLFFFIFCEQGCLESGGYGWVSAREYKFAKRNIENIRSPPVRRRSAKDVTDKWKNTNHSLCEYNVNHHPDRSDQRFMPHALFIGTGMRRWPLSRFITSIKLKLGSQDVSRVAVATTLRFGSAS